MFVHAVAEVHVPVIAAVTTGSTVNVFSSEKKMRRSLMCLRSLSSFFARSSRRARVFSDSRGLFMMALDFHPASFTTFDTVADAKKCSFAKKRMDFVRSSFSDLMIALAASSVLDARFFPVGLAHSIDFPSIIFLTRKTFARWTPRHSTMPLTLDPARSISDISFRIIRNDAVVLLFHFLLHFNFLKDAETDAVYFFKIN